MSDTPTDTDPRTQAVRRGPYRKESWPERWYAVTGIRPNVVKVETKYSGRQYSHVWRFK